MSMSCCAGARFRLATLVLLLAASIVCGGERKGRPKLGDYNPQDASVEMFAAIDAGQIEVKFIPRDSKQARILITNKTDKPLNVQLPDAFVGVPVLAQFGPNGGNQNGGNQGGGNQAVGSGNNQQGNQNQGDNFFNVPAEKVGQVRVACVCLEHGKPDPRAAIPYEIRPLASFTTDPAVHELMKLLASGEHSQHVVQAAAWHLCDKMSWKELGKKWTSELNGLGQAYFSRREIQAATRLVELAQERALEQAAPTSSVTQTE